MEHVRDALAKMRNPRTNQVVTEWKSMLPPGSRWNPGDPGRPDCRVCQGTGYVRLELPVGHPNFGKVFLCDCVDVNKFK